MSDKIVKLVFLRVDQRKAVVPLVEGSDYEQFLQRVRRRLGVADNVTPTLTDAATGVVDSIDRLLEVDEGTTLEVRLPFAAPAQTPPPPPAAAVPVSTAAASSPQRGPTQRASLAPPTCGAEAAASVGGGAPPEYRVDVLGSPGGDGEDDTGAAKYQRRRPRGFVSLARSSRVVAALLVLAGLGFAAYRFVGV